MKIDATFLNKIYEKKEYLVILHNLTTTLHKYTEKT